MLPFDRFRHFNMQCSLHLFIIIVSGRPVLTQEMYKPINTNTTQGENAVFKCYPDANPAADIQWYINGDVADGKIYD